MAHWIEDALGRVDGDDDLQDGSSDGAVHRWGPAGLAAVPVWRLPRMLLALLLWVSLAQGCAIQGPGAGAVDPIRASEMLDDADPARRASTRLVIEGLDADTNFDRRQARGSYERAIQVDPTNPMAYLALARHELDDMEGQRALQLLEQAAALFEAEGLRVDRVGVHINGLRGLAYESLGQEGSVLLDRAASLAPDVWGDSHLSPDELR